MKVIKALVIMKNNDAQDIFAYKIDFSDLYVNPYGIDENIVLKIIKNSLVQLDDKHHYIIEVTYENLKTRDFYFTYYYKDLELINDFDD